MGSLELSMSSLPLPPFLEKKGTSRSLSVFPYKQDSNYLSRFCSQETCIGSKGWGLLVPQACSPRRSLRRRTQLPFARNSLALCKESFILQQLTKEDPFTFRGAGRAGIREILFPVLLHANCDPPNSFCQL